MTFFIGWILDFIRGGDSPEPQESLRGKEAEEETKKEQRLEARRQRAEERRLKLEENKRTKRENIRSSLQEKVSISYNCCCHSWIFSV